MSAPKKTKRKSPSKKAEPKKVGRPSLCTPEITEVICARLSGGESLRAICRDESMPHVATVCRWVVTNEAFREQYMQAREAAGYAHADAVIEVVESLRDGMDPQVARAMMEGLRWAAERMAPKAHSPKSVHEHTGKDGGPIQQITRRIVDPKDGA